VSPWSLGFAIGAAVVVVVALLLIGILLVARKIAGLAATALAVAAEIEKATTPIWAIGTANGTIEDIVRTVKSVDRHVASLADVLEGKGGGK